MPMKNPPHPGDFIRTEIIDPAALSVADAAKALQVSRPALSSLLNAKADFSGDMALRIEKLSASRWTRSCGCNPPTISHRRESVRRKSVYGGSIGPPIFPVTLFHKKSFVQSGQTVCPSPFPPRVYTLRDSNRCSEYRNCSYRRIGERNAYFSFTVFVEG